MTKKLIIVTSPPACGKTYISKALAKRLNHCVYLDKDTLIVLSKQIFVVAHEEYNRSSAFFEANIRDYEYAAIVDLALEGSAIYSWISRNSFEADEELSAILKNRRLYIEEADWITEAKTASAGKTDATPVTAETDAGSKSENKPVSPDKGPADLLPNHASSPLSGNRKILAALPKPHVDKVAPPLPDIPRERRMTALYNHKIYPLRSMSILKLYLLKKL